MSVRAHSQWHVWNGPSWVNSNRINESVFFRSVLCSTVDYSLLSIFRGISFIVLFYSPLRTRFTRTCCRHLSLRLGDTIRPPSRIFGLLRPANHNFRRICDQPNFFPADFRRHSIRRIFGWFSAAYSRMHDDVIDGEAFSPINSISKQYLHRSVFISF